MGTLAIIDYGMGNLRSLRNAFARVGVAPTLITEGREVEAFSHIVVPGVGAFGAAMDNLRTRGFVEPLRAHVEAGRPLLGICLGMQLLATIGTEFGEHAGLGLVPGRVDALPASAEYPTPHVGWNSLKHIVRHPVMERSKAAADYYFVHSFAFRVDAPTHRVATADYGTVFDAVVARGSALGVQFHPEKSHTGGLRILETFSEWDGSAGPAWS
ncbi:MAG: imidazole glycerol phosphate synthase subunit HisH [Deltaproteobacteria bacterium]|nr:imidazole glycerol phosphate synthase subunit HisH [Deltaproteobacteria bacterium]